MKSLYFNYYPFCDKLIIKINSVFYLQVYILMLKQFIKRIKIVYHKQYKNIITIYIILEN